MQKTEAIQLLGMGNSTLTARRLGVTRQTLRNWPNDLTVSQINMVNGALVQLEAEREALKNKGKA